MDGETIIQVVTIVSAAIVTIVGLLVRAEVQDLKREVLTQNEQINSLQKLVSQQNTQINGLLQQLSIMSNPIKRPPAWDNLPGLKE